jgi:hypothetical protein
MQKEFEIQIYEKLDKIECEMENMKALILQISQRPKQIVSLGGILKEIEITEDDIEEAKNSLFKTGI